MLFLALTCAVSGFGTIRGIVDEFRGTPVAQAAIEIPQALEVCHHHPEGCPKDCFCPKTTVRIEPGEGIAEHVEPAESAGESKDPANLYETTWVNCNEEGSTSAAPAHFVFLPSQGLRIVWSKTPATPVVQAAIGPERAFRVPPQKIPIV